jgi:hypothetical protein
MATEVSETLTEAPQEKKLKAIPWNQKTGLTDQFAIRSVKMIAAVCEHCKQSGMAWWNVCPHDPYHSTQVEETTKYETAPDENGNEIVTGEKIEKTFKRIPNVRQVALTLRVASGMEVEKALANGWKFPQDVSPNDGKHSGYAPMCEYQNCYASNPTVKTTHYGLTENRNIPASRYTAHYCTVRHAKLARLRDDEEVRREVFDQGKRRKQIADYPI